MGEHPAVALTCPECNTSYPYITDALTPCPGCGGRLTRPGEQLHDDKQIDLVKVVKAQRGMLIALLVCIVLQLLSLTGVRLYDGAPWWLLTAISAVGSIIAIVYTVRLMTALRMHWLLRVLLILLLIMSCVGLIVMLIVNQRATRKLRASGVRVGFIGANEADAKAAMDPSRCATCGYSLVGNISNLCPECGTPVPVTARAVIPRVAQVAAHRKGAILVTPVPCNLPEQCLKCATTDDLRWYKKTYRWHSMLVYLTLLGTPLLYLIVALAVRKRVTIQFALCRHHVRHQRNIRIATALAVVGCILMVAVGFTYDDGVMIVAVLLLLVVLIIATTLELPLRIINLTDQQAEFKGASEAFLAALPLPVSGIPVTTAMPVSDSASGPPEQRHHF